jgi:hypothetical protein
MGRKLAWTETKSEDAYNQTYGQKESLFGLITAGAAAALYSQDTLAEPQIAELYLPFAAVLPVNDFTND